MFSPPCYRRRGCSCYLMYSRRTFCYRTALADPGGRPRPPLILDQTEAQTAGKIFLWRPPPPPRSGSGTGQWLSGTYFGTIFTLNIFTSFRKRVSGKTKLRLQTVRDPFLFSVSCLVSGKNPDRKWNLRVGVLPNKLAKAGGSKHHWTINQFLTIDKRKVSGIIPLLDFLFSCTFHPWARPLKE